MDLEVTFAILIAAAWLCLTIQTWYYQCKAMQRQQEHTAMQRQQEHTASTPVTHRSSLDAVYEDHEDAAVVATKQVVDDGQDLAPPRYIDVVQRV